MITNPEITKVLKIKTDDIIEYRYKMGCGLLDAKKGVEFHKLMDYIDNAKSVQEFRNILQIIALRTY